MDIAEGHKAALDTLFSSKPKFLIINLGSGKGTSVIELINKFESSTGIEIPYDFGPRREGDSAMSLANPMKALKYIKWKSKRNIEDICRDSWNWQYKNPRGYK